MGRIKKYFTKEQKAKMNRKWALEYYYRNRERINKRAMEKYYAKKYDNSSRNTL